MSKILLMCTDLKQGRSYIKEDFSDKPYGLAAELAFAKKAAMNAMRSPGSVYWVKITDNVR